MKLFLRTVVLLLGFGCAALTADAVRVALLPLDETARNFADLVLARESGNADSPFVFVERGEFEAIKKEFLLAPQSELFRNLLQNAELFYLVRGNAVVVFEGQYGVRLADRSVADVAAGVRLLYEAQEKRRSFRENHFPKLSFTPAVPSVLTPEERRELEVLERDMHRYFVNRPDCVVLERRQLRFILDEPAAECRTLLAGTAILRLTATHERGRLKLRCNVSGKMIPYEGSLDGFAEKLLALPSDPVRDLAAEAAFFAAEAEFASVNALHDNAEILAEAAVVLDPGRRNELVLAEVIGRHCQDGAQTEMDMPGKIRRLRRAFDIMVRYPDANANACLSALGQLRFLRYGHFQTLPVAAQHELKTLLRDFERNQDGLRKRSSPADDDDKRRNMIGLMRKLYERNHEYSFDLQPFVDYALPGIVQLARAVEENPELWTQVEYGYLRLENTLNDTLMTRKLAAATPEQRAKLLEAAKLLERSPLLNFALVGTAWRLEMEKTGEGTRALNAVALELCKTRSIVNPVWFRLPRHVLGDWRSVDENAYKIAVWLGRERHVYVPWGLYNFWNKTYSEAERREIRRLASEFLAAREKAYPILVPNMSDDIAVYYREVLRQIRLPEDKPKAGPDCFAEERVLLEAEDLRRVCYDRKRYAYAVQAQKPQKHTRLFRMDLNHGFKVDAGEVLPECFDSWIGDGVALTDDAYVLVAGNRLLICPLDLSRPRMVELPEFRSRHTQVVGIGGDIFLASDPVSSANDQPGVLLRYTPATGARKVLISTADRNLDSPAYGLKKCRIRPIGADAERRRLIVVVAEEVNGSLQRHQVWSYAVDTGQWLRLPGPERYVSLMRLGVSRNGDVWFSDEYGNLTCVDRNLRRTHRKFDVGKRVYFQSFSPDFFMSSHHGFDPETGRLRAIDHRLNPEFCQIFKNAAGEVLILAWSGETSPPKIKFYRLKPKP